MKVLSAEIEHYKNRLFWLSREIPCVSDKIYLFKLQCKQWKWQRKLKLLQEGEGDLIDNQEGIIQDYEHEIRELLCALKRSNKDAINYRTNKLESLCKHK